MTSVASFFFRSIDSHKHDSEGWEKRKKCCSEISQYRPKGIQIFFASLRCHRCLRSNVNMVIRHLCAPPASNMDFNIAIQMQIKKLIQIVQIFFEFMNSVFCVFLLIKISYRLERFEKIFRRRHRAMYVYATYWQLIGRNGVYCEIQIKSKRWIVRALWAGAVYNGKTNKLVSANRRTNC